MPQQTKTWTVSDISQSTDHGILELESGEYFHVLETPTRLVFGGVCNAGFLESGYIEKQEGESSSEVLEELLADLEVYYRDGAQYTSRIVCNERM